MRHQHRRFHLVMVVFMVIGMLSNTLAASAAQDLNADLTATAESTTESSSESTPATQPPASEPPAPAATEPPVVVATEPPVTVATEPAAPGATEPVSSATEETVVVSTETADAPEAGGEASGMRISSLAATDDEPSCEEGHVGVDLGSGRVTSVNASLTNPANWDSRVQFNITWDVPDSAQVGDFFTFQLPSELAWVNMYIPLDGGVGVATVVNGTVKIVLSNFVCTHNNVHGTLWVDAAWKNASEHAGEDVTLEVDGNVVVVTVPNRPPTPTPKPPTPTPTPKPPTPTPTEGPSPTPKPPTPTATPKPPTPTPTVGPSPTPTPASPSNPSKSGKFTNPNDQGVAEPTNALEWTINTGRPGGASPVDVTVTETVNGAWGWEINCSTVSINQGGVLQSCSTTSLVVKWTALSPNVSARVVFKATITGQLTGYENTAVISKPGATTASQFVSRLSGGGGGEGDFVKRPSTPFATAGSCLGGAWTPPTVILPANETGMTYSWVTPLNPETGAYAIKATLGQGYSWTASWPAGWVKDGNTATYTSSVAVNPCSTIVPVAPGVTDGACVDGETRNPSVTPVVTEGIAYSFTTAPDPVTGGAFVLQATLADGKAWGTMPTGWTKTDATTATYTGNVVANPCTKVVPVNPTVDEGDCINGGVVQPSVTLPANANGITYTKSGAEVSEGTVIVTAKLGEGKSWDTLPDGWSKVDATTAKKTITLPKVECESVVPVAPEVTDGACVNGETSTPTVTLAITSGIVYTFTTAPDPVTGGPFTVQAKLADGKAWGTMPEGWTKADSTTATYSGTAIAAPCDAIVPVEPTVDDGDCINGGIVNPSVTLPANANGITYTKSGAEVSEGTVIVTAKLGEGKSWGTLPDGWSKVDATTAKKTITLPKVECESAVPVDPTVNQGDCLNGGIVHPSVTLAPNGSGITYSKSGAEVSEGTVIVTARLGDGYSWGTMPAGWNRVDSTTATRTVNLPKVECETAIPVDPEVTEGDCINGGIVNPTVVLEPNGNGITYAKSGGEAPGATVLVTASLADGYAWGTMPAGWSKVDATTATFTVNLKDVDCEEVIPAAPVVEEAACISGVVTTPTVTLQTTNGITYSKDGAEVSGGSVVVTARLADGYEWGSMPEGWTRVNSTTATFTVELLDVECDVVELVDPVVNDGACVGGEVINPSVTTGTTEGVTYTKAGAEVSEGTVVVTAKLADGYGWPTTLPEGWTKVDSTTATFTIELPKVECALVTPIAPEVSEAACITGVVNNPVVTLAQTTGISYVKDGAEVSGGTVIVTATVIDGYGWPETLPDGWTKDDSATATFTVQLLDIECTVVEPVAPTVEEAACITGVVTVPSVTLVETTGITYTKDGAEVPGGVVVVTAVVQDGFGWPEVLPDGWTKIDDATATYTVDLQDVECAPVTLVDPKVDDTSCLDGTVVPPSITLPTTPGVTYTQDGNVTPGGTVIVTATVEDGFGWPEALPDGWTKVDDATATFTVTFGTVTCEKPVTPPTPTTPTTPVKNLPVTGVGPADAATSAMPLSMLLMALATLLALAGLGIRTADRRSLGH